MDDWQIQLIIAVIVIIGSWISAYLGASTYFEWQIKLKEERREAYKKYIKIQMRILFINDTLIRDIKIQDEGNFSKHSKEGIKKINKMDAPELVTEIMITSKKDEMLEKEIKTNATLLREIGKIWDEIGNTKSIKQITKAQIGILENLSNCLSANIHRIIDRLKEKHIE